MSRDDCPPSYDVAEREVSRRKGIWKNIPTANKEHQEKYIHLKIQMCWCRSWTISCTIRLKGLVLKINNWFTWTVHQSYSFEKTCKTYSEYNHQPSTPTWLIVIPSNKVTSGLSTRIVIGITYQGVAWHQQKEAKVPVIHLCTLDFWKQNKFHMEKWYAKARMIDTAKAT